MKNTPIITVLNEVLVGTN